MVCTRILYTYMFLLGVSGGWLVGGCAVVGARVVGGSEHLLHRKRSHIAVMQINLLLLNSSAEGN